MASKRNTPPTITDLLDRAGVRLGDVAAAAGVSPRHLLALRRGEIRTPTSRTIARLAVALGARPSVVRAALELAIATAASKG